MTPETESRRRVAEALRHRQPDRIPIDFGSTSVTGIHVECVAALREHYGLEKRPVKIHEPYQMLGLIEEDLRLAMGIDTVGVFPRKTMFGFPAERWKEWNFRGLDVLVPEDFRVHAEPNGDLLIYPEGDVSAPPSGRMAEGSAFFDSIVRQPPLDEDRLDPEENCEEFTAVTADDLAYIRREVACARSTGGAVVASFGGTGFGDIALVPAPFLKYPKGIRDITEWYVSTSSRRDYIHRVFERQCEVAIENLNAFTPWPRTPPISCSSAAPISERRPPPSAPSPPSASCGCRTTSESTSGSTQTRRGARSSTPAAASYGSWRASSRPASTSSTPCSAPPPEWTRSTSSRPTARGWSSGAAA